MSFDFFAYLYRMKYIARWSLMKNSSTENVAEHSLTTAMFAHALGVISNSVYHGSVDPDRLASLAVFHEASEVFTGDLPTPIKYANEETREVFQRLEKNAEENLLVMLPAEMREAYAPLVHQTYTQEERAFVKAADRLAALVKCKEELKSGNREFVKAADATRKSLNEMKLREVAYFMQNFMPSFERTLDEMEGS